MAQRIDVKDVNIYYGSFKAVEDVSMTDRAALRDRLHRPVGLRQVDLPAHAQPDARGHPRRPRGGHGRAGRRATSTAPASTPSPCAARSAWSSSGPTPSRRCRSSTTWPPGLRLNGEKNKKAR